MRERPKRHDAHAKEKILTETTNKIRFHGSTANGGCMNKDQKFDRMLCTIMICGTVMVFLMVVGSAVL